MRLRHSLVPHHHFSIDPSDRNLFFDQKDGSSSIVMEDGDMLQPFHLDEEVELVSRTIGVILKSGELFS